MNRKINWILFIATLCLGVWFFLPKKLAPVSESEVAAPEAAVAPITSPQKDSVVEESEPVKVVSDFSEEYQAVHQKLPTFEKAKGWSEEEVHHAPKEVLEGGKAIGKLIDAAEKAPERRESTLKFFVTCAEDEEILPSIRALCWKQTNDQIVKWKVFIPISEAQVSEEIKILATKL